MKKPMKLLSIAHSSGMGGANISWINTLKGLKEYGFSIKVIVPQEGLLSEKLRDLKINYEVVPFFFSVFPNNKGVVNKLLYFPRLSYHEVINFYAKRKILRIAKEFDANVIHSNGSVIDIGLYSSSNLRIPHVWHLREYGDLDFQLHFIPNTEKYKRKIREKSYSISITPDIFQHFAIKKEFGKVIYNGIYSDKFRPEIKSKERFFIYVGGIYERKGVSELLESYLTYKEKGGDCSLYFLGPYDNHYVEALKTKYNLGKDDYDVLFLGRVNNVGDYMNRALAIIVSSYNEGFGRITAEAMWHHCLVIGRDTAGTRLQFEIGKDYTGKEIGMRFSDKEDLIAQMISVSNMKWDEYKSITDNAYKTVTSHYSIERNIIETKNYLEYLINNGKQS